MRKTIGILFGISCWLLLMLGSVQAATSIDQLTAIYDPASSQVTISGVISSGMGKEISVRVVSPDEDTPYLNQLTSGVSGIFSFSYGMDNPVAGTYQVTINGVSSTTFECPGSSPGVRITPLLASVDQSSQKVIINGIINTGTGQQIALKILDADNIPFVDQITSGSEGFFSYSFTPANYGKGIKVEAKAVGMSHPATTSFDYIEPVVTISNLAASLDEVSHKVLISGNISSGSGKEIALRIISPTDDNVYQITSGENGYFSFVYNVSDCISGTYKVDVCGSGMSTPNTTTFTLPVVNSDASINQLSASISANKLVIISGVISSGAGQSISLRITKPDGSFEYAYQTSSEMNGIFRFTYQMNEVVSGQYSVTVNGPPGTTAGTTSFSLTNNSTPSLDLSNIILSKGSLAPLFAAAITDYNVEVGAEVNQVDISPIAVDSPVNITINNSPTNSGSSYTLNLASGDNPVTIIIQAGDKQKIYHLTIKRQVVSQPISVQVLDDHISLQNGNRAVNNIDASWIIRVSAGTLKNISSNDILYKDLPGGLTLSASRIENSNDIEIKIAGLADTQIDRQQIIKISVKSSAVDGGNWTDSSEVSVNINPVSDCFIATACFGSYLDPHVYVLRNFRDNILLKSVAGRWFVAEYYHYSPPIAAYLATHKGIRMLVRILLTPIVYIIRFYQICWLILLCVISSLLAFKYKNLPNTAQISRT